jgi:hypothetical protein
LLKYDAFASGQDIANPTQQDDRLPDFRLAIDLVDHAAHEYGRLDPADRCLLTRDAAVEFRRVDAGRPTRQNNTVRRGLIPGQDIVG